MGPLTALVLATPIFGFALSPPSLAALPTSSLPMAAQIDASASFETDTSLQVEEEPAELGAPASTAAPGPDYVTQLRKRARIAKVHRTLGIATWAMTAFAVISGTIQYRNLYGAPFVTEREDTPCVTGDAWINQNQCSGTPWFHAITGMTTGALYFTTMGLAMAMPDPDNAAEGSSKYAKTLRTHKALRWVHLTGMVAQVVIGLVIANPRLGLDRANDFGALKALAGLHLASGYVTLGALTWAGSVMLF